jgi:hypothetical protein
MAYLIGKGTVLQVLNGTFQTVTQVKQLTPPQLEMGTTEVTHLGSSMRERVATINDPGEASFMLEFDPANTQHQYLITNALTGAQLSWKIILSNTTSTITFSACIKKWGIGELQADNVATIPVTLQINGLVTVTP